MNANNDLLRQQEIFDGSYWADNEDDDHESWEE